MIKNVRIIAVAMVLFVAATSFTNAQSKVAHINVQQLLAEMPEMKAAQAELKKLEETYGADIQSSMAELQGKYKQYETEAASKTEEENQKRAIELQGMKQNIDNAQQEAMKQMQQKQADLFAPISEKAKNAIDKVAAAQGYDYVVDASPGLGIIVAKGKDLLADVKVELSKAQ